MIKIHPALAGSGPLPGDHVPYVVVACPGNGTRYTIALTPLPNPDAEKALEWVAAEDWKQGVRSSYAAPGGTVLVSLWPGERNSACAAFRFRGGYLAPSYVAEKLRVGDADAEALAAIIGELLDRPNPATPVREVRS